MKVAWVVILVAGCTTSEVRLTGPRRVPRVPTCEVELVQGAPAFPVTDLATARADCPFADPPFQDCLRELRMRACQVGADTIYGVTESLAASASGVITATLAVRNQSAAKVAAAGCTPICSPGFDCQAGQCVPLCNPTCAPNEICNRQRTCESQAPAGNPPP